MILSSVLPTSCFDFWLINFYFQQNCHLCPLHQAHDWFGRSLLPVTHIWISLCHSILCMTFSIYEVVRIAVSCIKLVCLWWQTNCATDNNARDFVSATNAEKKPLLTGYGIFIDQLISQHVQDYSTFVQNAGSRLVKCISCETKIRILRCWSIFLTNAWRTLSREFFTI